MNKASKLIRVPNSIYKEAEELQRNLRVKGVNVNIWACVVEVKKRRDGYKYSDPFGDFRL